MGNSRGLRTRLCPGCQEITPHRTLYARATVDGKRRWLQLFVACTKCRSLNHVHTTVYGLERASSPLPSALMVTIVSALEQGPLDFDELVASLKRRKSCGPGHVFKREVELALGFLKVHTIVSEELRDRTEKGLEILRASTRGLSTCPVDSQRTLVSLHSQRQENAIRGAKFVSEGAFCLNCGYRQGPKVGTAV